jgi:hypothetical protein
MAYEGDENHISMSVMPSFSRKSIFAAEGE